jgi:organic radical activating enzyme
MAKRKKPMGKRTPWVWSIEFTRGCNLACWHCTARIFPEDGSPRFMSIETFTEMCKVMNVITPRTRLELAQGGEPTLNPNLYECLQIARKLTPTTQIQVTTNGLTLLSGEVTYRKLFAAGAHSVYVDMYGQKEKHIEMAKAAGAEWYKYNEPKIGTENHKMANTYYGDPNMRLIILQDSPEYRLRWRNEGRLSTFLNHIDWDVSMPYGLIPVREPYARKCTMPMRYVSTSYEGDYLFCCIDFWCETAGLMGNVRDGVEGFKNYWFGLLMQSIRRRLALGDRAGVPYCSRCNCAFAKCDWIRIWPEHSFDWWWKNSEWLEMPPLDGKEEMGIFDDGWQFASETEQALPSFGDEIKVLSESDKRIIKSTAAISKTLQRARE